MIPAEVALIWEVLKETLPFANDNLLLDIAWKIHNAQQEEAHRDEVARTEAALASEKGE